MLLPSSIPIPAFFFRLASFHIEFLQYGKGEGEEQVPPILAWGNSTARTSLTILALQKTARCRISYWKKWRKLSVDFLSKRGDRASLGIHKCPEVSSCGERLDQWKNSPTCQRESNKFLYQENLGFNLRLWRPFHLTEGIRVELLLNLCAVLYHVSFDAFGIIKVCESELSCVSFAVYLTVDSAHTLNDFFR